jgi:hypothetical protein
MDAAARGVFLSLSLTLPATTALVEKMVSNQSWNKEVFRPTRGVKVCINARR